MMGAGGASSARDSWPPIQCVARQAPPRFFFIAKRRMPAGTLTENEARRVAGEHRNAGIAWTNGGWAGRSSE
jgi:hypothetical protein